MVRKEVFSQHMIGSRGWRGNFTVPVMVSENEADIYSVDWKVPDKGWQPSKKLGTLRYDPLEGKFWKSFGGASRDVTQELIDAYVYHKYDDTY